MKKQIPVNQFLDTLFKNKKFPSKALKEFVALGFLSAHTQLLVNWDEVKQDGIMLNAMAPLEYLDDLIERNVSKLDNDFVQSLFEYIKLLCRRRCYKEGVIIPNNDTEKITSKLPAFSNQAVLASINLGIEAYQKKYMLTIDQTFGEYIANNKYIANLKNERTIAMNEFEQEQNEEMRTTILSESFEEGDVHDLINNVTSDKLIVTSTDEKFNPTEYFGQPFQTTEIYEFHEYADTLPIMDNDELTLLTEGIRENGQYDPILLYNNKLADGRNRYLACRNTNIPVSAMEWLGTEEQLVLYIYEKNLNRRNLTSSQRAMSSHKLLAKAKILAKERQGERNDLKVSIETVINNAFPELKPGRPKKNDKCRATDDVAKRLKSNRTYVTNAEYIHEKAPELADLVLKKILTIPKAHSLAQKLSQKEDRDEALERYRNDGGKLETIIREIQMKRTEGTEQNKEMVEEAGITILARHDITISEAHIKQLEEAYGTAIKIKLRKKPKE